MITTILTAAVTEPGFDLFLETLPIMGAGMLGIFAVTGVIIAAIYLLGLIKKGDK